MADFIQLTVKRRQTKRGFLDLLYKLGRNEGDPVQLRLQVKQTVERWLISDGALHDPPRVDDRVGPFDILSAAFNRICEIAGHSWLEFVKDAGDEHISNGFDRPLNHDDLHLAEFTPEPDVDLMLEVFAAEQGGFMLWRNVTSEHVENLFAPLLDESHEHRQPAPKSTRPANGRVNGTLNYLSPDHRREYPEGWFENLFRKPTGDRFGAYVTPVWQVEVRTEVQESVHPFYSFTPEHYDKTDNCITWASRVLDTLLAADWLEVIRRQCKMGQPYCRKRSKGLARRACNPYHIREQGRVKCLDLYLGKADGARIKGLKKFA